MTTYTNDPFEAADNPQIKPAEYFGKLEVDAWFCALVKGQGKVPFDTALHPADQRRTAIDLHVITLAAHNMNYPMTRGVIAESPEWTKTVWPSLRDAGVQSLRDLKDTPRWCCVTTVSTGRTYQSNGVTKEATTFRFLALYASEAECQAAFIASRNGSNGDDWLDAPVQAPPVNGHAEQRERETALAFARILVKQSHSIPELGERLAQYPLVGRFFTVDSPEISEMVQAGELAPF